LLPLITPFFAQTQITGQCNSRACCFCLLFVVVLGRNDFYPDALENDDQNDEQEEEYYRSFLPPGLLSHRRRNPMSVIITTHRRNRYRRLQIERLIMMMFLSARVRVRQYLHKTAA